MTVGIEPAVEGRRRMHRGAPILDIDVFGDKHLGDPRPGQALLRDAGPVVWLERYGAWGMARFAEVSASLRDWETFCSGRGVGFSDFAKETPWRPPSLLLETDPPIHGQMRAVMNPLVSVTVLNGCRERWREVADGLLRELLAEEGSFNAAERLCQAFPLRVFPDLIGVQQEGRENLLVYASLAFNAFGPRNPRLEDALRDSQDAGQWMAASCRRSALQSNGLGAQVFAAVDRGEIAEDEGERLVRSFLTAGVDTTISGLTGLVKAFADHPDQWNIVRADRSLVRGAFEEALRWFSPVQTFFRTTTRPVAIGGVQIGEGEKVLLFLSSANHDPRRWPEPERFDVRRRAGGHVGFGLGIHSCLGQLVARLESEIVLSAMLDHIETFEPAGEPIVRLNNTLFSYADLPIRVTRSRNL